MDKVVNLFGRDLINMCITRDMIIANGRTMGDADGYCTYYADNMLGRSSVDLCVVSTTLFPSNNNNNKRPLTPKSMPPAGDEHAKLKT